MQKLKEIFDPDAAPDENVTTVCAMEVPTKEEVWASVKEAPAAAWEGVKASIPELPDLPEVDWSGVWTSIEGGATKAKFAAVASLPAQISKSSHSTSN